MVKASEKLSVLSAEAPISAPIVTDGAAYYQLQEEMRSAFECSVVDLPRAMLVQHPHLLADIKAPKVDVYFVYPEELRNSKRVAVFRDFLLARLAEMH